MRIDGFGLRCHPRDPVKPTRQVCKCPRGAAQVAVLVVCICLTRNPKVGYYGLTKGFGKFHMLILQTQPGVILHASQTFFKNMQAPLVAAKIKTPLGCRCPQKCRLLTLAHKALSKVCHGLPSTMSLSCLSVHSESPLLHAFV